MASSRQASGLCPDWVLSINSTVHVARDRGWYSTYTPFQTYVTTFVAGQRLEAVGIGDMELPVHLYPKRSGPDAHGKFRLNNVLHIPTNVCNILAGPRVPGREFGQVELFGIGESGDDGEILDRDSDRRVAYLDNSGSVWRVKLSPPPIGPVVGESPIQSGRMYLIHAFWPESERTRWDAEKAARNTLGPSRAASIRANDDDSAHLNRTEKRWLRRRWGGELKFLTAHGLSIHKDEDRKEGRRIVRAIRKENECTGPKEAPKTAKRALEADSDDGPKRKQARR